MMVEAALPIPPGAPLEFPMRSAPRYPVAEARPNTAAASLVPMDADVADMAHAQNKDALVGWVHPFDELPDPYKDAKLTNELPISRQ